MVEPLPDYPLARLTTVRTGGAAERFGIELEPEVQLLGDVRFPW